MKFTFALTVVSAFSTLLAPAFAAPSPINELDVLVKGNSHYRKRMERHHPGLLEDLTTNGQHPPYTIFSCSDSRVKDALIFNALPGDLFSSISIANQLHESDTNGYAVLGYSVEHLHIRHVIIMGHYGCGGVQAAMLPVPSGVLGAAESTVQAWVEPIRELFDNSTRPEIVAWRDANADNDNPTPPEIHDPAFRALVEENVIANVARTAASAVVTEYWDQNEDADLFVHGLVYDIEDGNVYNLGVSVGRPGSTVPAFHFPSPP